MQRIISFLGKNLLVIGLVSLISLSGAFFVAVQPSYATVAQERMSNSSKKDQTPEQAYEQVVKEAKDAVNNPQALDEAYDQDQKAHKQEQGGLLEGAKKALEKVTNAD
ncbi:hypothetical protein H6F76_16740 [Leptolyngbya sp. FACHB-321]|uniref:hypothetical protein n=1 Tax=Leptolyngbya sp. FACHB-321 TaxID=2692807 RepID=UPI001682422F|nr:hypothetical protein [Leptolyngbya sp. FACHB-321]MBD2036658.1 hypothetical protein [Leptolyngbya sp. FACHB-321]